MRVAVLALAAAAAAAAAGGAAAHGEGTHSGFVSTVSTIEPAIPGLLVQVLRGHEQLSVANLTRKRVVVLRDDGTPRVTIEPGETEVWTEPRIGANESPPEREGLVRNWRIPGKVDGEPFAIVGFLGYRPPAGIAAAEDEGLGTWAIVAATLGGVVGLGAAVALPLWLARRERDDEAAAA